MKLESGPMRNEPTELQLMTNPITARKRATYLSVVDMFSLYHQCLMLREAGFSVYLVGSCLTRPDYRDVDLRAIVDDKEFGALNRRRQGATRPAQRLPLRVARAPHPAADRFPVPAYDRGQC